MKTILPNLNSVTNMIRVHYRNFYTTTPIYAHWVKDFMAGPLPKTVNEHKDSAEKYNLHPKEYKPHAEYEYYGLGDYPKLPIKGVATKDPFYPYDFPEYRRNLNEPVPVDFDILKEDRCDIGVPERYSNKVILLSYFLIFGTLFGLCFTSDSISVFQPVAEKQYPWKGKTYYTF